MDDNKEDIFKKYGDYHVKLYFYECGNTVSLEYLYQQFKARMISEMEEAKEEQWTLKD